MRNAGIIVFLLGALALASGGFTYVTGTHEVDLGLVALQTEDREWVNLPAWVGALTMLLGGVMILHPTVRRAIGSSSREHPVVPIIGAKSAGRRTVAPRGTASGQPGRRSSSSDRASRLPWPPRRR